MADCLKNLSRRKKLITFHLAQNGLKKSMGTYDLIFLGIGSTLGVGIYLLCGTVAKHYAGPSIMISFFLAAIISLLAGICYAEFGACAPTSGSIYSYSYITLGEFVAFLMGWNLITQYIIGAASVLKAVSVHMDSYLNYTIQAHLREVYVINVPYLSSYFDVVAFLLAVILSVLLSFGLQESMKLNAVLTSVNVSLVLFFIIVGLSKVDIENWNLPATAVPWFAGEGGFMPYGITGIIKGASVCFYAFIGFDCIATTGEEVVRPSRTLPVALIVSITVSFLAYFGVSSVLTLLVPYYLQDESAPLVFALEYTHLSWAKWIVKVGSFFGLCASLFGAFFPVSRIIYAMAQDGLLYKIFGKVHKKYKTPVVATMFSGVITGLTAAVLEVNDLINLNSLGTLLSYSIVALCVIILRYSADISEKKPLLANSNSKKTSEFQQKSISYLVTACMIIFCALTVLLAWVVQSKFSCKLPIITVIILIMVLELIIINKQPSCEERLQLPFKVPLVPFLPAMSVFFNIFFMMHFDFMTWMRFCFWLALGKQTYFVPIFNYYLSVLYLYIFLILIIFSGLMIYFSYGIFHSNERRKISLTPFS